MNRVTLGDVAKERRETCKEDKGRYPVVGLEHLTPEEIDLTAWDEGSENTFTKMFHKGDILFGRRRAYLKKAAIAPFDGICSGDITVIEAKPDYILPELLPFVIQNDAFFDFAVEKSAGSLSPRAKWEHLKDYEFNLSSMDEQRKLARVLWAINDTIEAYKKLIAATDELVKSQFIEMFGDPMENPMRWEVMALNESCQLLTGNTPSRKEAGYYGSFMEWIKSNNISPSSMFLTEAEERLSESGAAVGRVVAPGTILMTCIAGSLNTIGNVAIVDRQVAFNQQINALVPQKYETMVLYYLLQLIRPQLHEAANSALKCILNKGTLGSIRTIVPDRNLQKTFAKLAEQTDKSKFELERALAAAKATYKSIISNRLGADF